MNYQLEIGTMSKKIEWSRCSTYKTRTQQDYISILIHYNLYKWGARDGEYPDTPPFSGYNFFKKRLILRGYNVWKIEI